MMKPSVQCAMFACLVGVCDSVTIPPPFETLDPACKRANCGVRHLRIVTPETGINEDYLGTTVPVRVCCGVSGLATSWATV